LFNQPHKNFWQITTQDGTNSIGIDKGQYPGDVEQAIEKIEVF